VTYGGPACAVAQITTAGAYKLLLTVSMTLSYSVSRMRSNEAIPDLRRIWAASLRGAGDVEERLDWYAKAPTPSDEVFVIAAQEGALPDRIVGTAGFENRTFAFGGRELRVGLGCNLSVEPAHRTLLPGLRLLRAVQRATTAELDLSYNFPNERAQPLFERAGYHELGPMPRYVRILRHAPYVRRFVPMSAFAGTAGAALDLVMGARYALHHRRAARALDLVWLDNVDARFDALWDRARDGYVLVGRRDASWLRWRYLMFPRSRARIAALVERGPAADVRAYALVTEHDGVAYVRDIFGVIGDLDPLLVLLLRELRERGATSASFGYLGSGHLVSLLAAHGFRRRATNRRVFVAPGNTLSPQQRALVMNPIWWHLTEYDEDC
jgi:hypothetical protein